MGYILLNFNLIKIYTILNINLTIKSLGQLINELALNLNNAINILSSYNSNDWILYYPSDEEFDKNKNTYGYQKKLIHVDDHFEIYLIFWSPYSSSPIHDHPEKGCVLKLLKGKLNEELYINKNTHVEYLKTISININDINNRNGNEILHKIINLNEMSISLHVYFPPKFKQNIFKI